MTNLIKPNDITMSSREIADLVEKRHDNVKRTIETLAERGVIQLPQIEEVKNHLGQTTLEYRIGKRDSYVIVAQLSPEFTARLVDRWQELEQGGAELSVDKLLSNPAQLLTLVQGYAEQVIALESKVEQDKPKTHFYDEYVNADGLYGLQNAARALACRPNKFAQWLKQDYLFYQGGNLVPRIKFIQKGYFEIKVTIIDEKARSRTFITPKGLEYFSNVVPDDVKLKAAA